MAKILVTDCPAGPALDAAVARVLGWERYPGEYVDHWIPPGFDLPVVRDWSDDIAAAWELAETADLFDNRYLTKNEDAKYVICPKHVGFGEWPEYYEGADERVALAITRAFLLAHGVTEVEVADD